MSWQRNVFSVSDVLLIPMVPTTLSVRSYEQVLDFLQSSNRQLLVPAVFFSMVDWRKKLHREVVESMPSQYGGFLESAIPYLSDIEQMGVYREPAPAFAPSSRAAKAYCALWDEVDRKLLTDHAP